MKMTVRLVTVIQNYIGLSTDTMPTSVKPGSTFWAWDTNARYVTYDGTNWVTERIGSFIAETTENLQQAAATYDLFTATGANVLVENFTFTLPNVDCSDDVNITSISVVTDETTPRTLVTTAQGAKANLVANASFSYSTPFTLPVGKKIRLTIAGGASDASTVCTATVKYQSIAPAGYMAG
jgi:hypothetical protein